ncbi:unnamed protein product [Bathycoccus prasinos]
MNDDPDDEREEEHALGLLLDHSVSSSEYSSSDEEVLLLPNDGTPTTELDLSGEDSFLTPSGNSPGYNLETDVDDTYSTHDIKIVFALWNAMVGAGSVLVFPWAMSQSGVFLGAIISPTFGFLCCVFSASRLVEHSVNTKKNSYNSNSTRRRSVQHAPTDYSDVVGEWFGKKWKRAARVGIVLLMVQSVVVYDMILSDVMFGLVSGGYSDWREQYDKEWERKKKNVRGGGDANSSSRNSSDAGGGGVNGTATALEDALFLMYDDANNSGGNGTIYATPPLPAAAPPSSFAPSSSSKDDADDDHHENNDLHINCQKIITWRSSLNGDCFTPKTASVIVALMLFAMSTRTSADVFVKLSAFGPAFTTYLVAFVLLQSLVVENVVAPRHFFPSRGGKAAFRGVATLLGACSSAFFVHHAVVPVLKTNKKSKNNMRNLVFAYILAAGTYMCVGIVGNFSSTYVASEAKREKIGLQGPSENFLNAFPTEPNKALFAFTAHVAAALQMFTICPLLLFILRTSVYGLFFGCRAESKTTLGGIAVINAVCLFIGTLCAADKNIDVGGVVSVCGAVFGFVYVFLLPSMIRLEATKDEAIGREAVQPPHHRYPLRSRHAVIQEEEEEEGEEDADNEESAPPLERRRTRFARRGRRGKGLGAAKTSSSSSFLSAHSYQTLFFHGAFVAFGFSILVSNVF